MDEPLDVIDAFVDGERVDPGALKQALANSAGRDYFVDVWTLREVMHDEPRVQTAAPLPPQRQSSARGWIVAIAASLACLVAGYAAGQRTRGSDPAVADQSVVVTTDTRGAAPSFPVPPATHAITVEFTPDATIRGGD